MKNFNKKIISWPNLYSNILLVLTLGSCVVVSACNDAGNTTPTPTPTSSIFCTNNIDNFTSVQSLSLIGSGDDPEWGPNLANLPFPTAFITCQSVASWNQQRVIDATAYWVSQKVNYCHHHVPTWYPTIESGFTACSDSTDVMPPVPVESMIRWNYSGIGAESASAWYFIDTAHPDRHATGNYAYGLDCSDYSKLIYSYAESMLFTSAVALQAGQASNESELAPNVVGFKDNTGLDILGLPSAGQLVCADGTTAPRGSTNTGCNGHGGYISVFDSAGKYESNAITNSMLNNLQPGDLVYIAGCGSNPNAQTAPSCGNPEQLVTHVVMWTGQKIGQSSTITNSMIAPETDTDDYGDKHGQCSNHDWWSVGNNMGNWIITDSHYQGPDYRAFTNCFYRNQVWGVRRVLGNN